MWRSLVARVLWEHQVAGSNPVAPTIDKTQDDAAVMELADMVASKATGGDAVWVRVPPAAPHMEMYR